jgi:hypothetical protein
MAVTPNYSWPVPVATDFVKDGWEAISDLGNAIDTTVAGLGSGLTLLKTQTIGTTVSSVVVTDVFSSSYSIYKIIVSGSGVASVTEDLNLKLGSSTTGYYKGGVRVAYTSSSTLLVNNNASSFTELGFVSSSLLNANIELIDPGIASFTKMSAIRVASDSSANLGGIHLVATAYTDFTLTPSAGTLTGGTIYVYGYEV